jgi:succinyl-CoA synthetase beta subunit
MDLLEYQAKELFRQVGIPTLPSQTIQQMGDLKRLHIPYPLVLKSQVRAGGRGKAGGIKFVENTIDAIAAASAIYHLPIGGEYPEAILAEARYDSQQEFFLAIVLDYQRQCPVLLGSSRGGIDTETLLDHMKSVPLTEPFSPYHARRLVIQMGLKGELVPAVSQIIEKMYGLFERYDLDLIEINPLGVDRGGEVMALDGKIMVNDSALARHPRLQGDLASPPPSSWEWFDKPRESGSVVILSNSLGLALNTWDCLGDLVYGVQVPASRRWLDNPVESLEAALKSLQSLSFLKVIFVHLLLHPELSLILSENLLREARLEPPSPGGDRLIRPTGAPAPAPKTAVKLPIPLVLRLGAWDEGYLPPSSPNCYWFQDFQGALERTRALGAPPETES